MNKKQIVLEKLTNNLEGSGFDAGSELFERKNDFMIKSEYHKMNELGYYTGWIKFKVIFPHNAGLEDFIIRGPRARNPSLFEYIDDTVYYMLNDVLEKVKSQYNGKK